jgi:hypothetical protein
VSQSLSTTRISSVGKGPLVVGALAAQHPSPTPPQQLRLGRLTLPCLALLLQVALSQEVLPLTRLAAYRARCALLAHKARAAKATVAASRSSSPTRSAAAAWTASASVAREAAACAAASTGAGVIAYHVWLPVTVLLNGLVQALHAHHDLACHSSGGAGDGKVGGGGSVCGGASIGRGCSPRRVAALSSGTSDLQLQRASPRHNQHPGGSGVWGGTTAEPDQGAQARLPQAQHLHHALRPGQRRPDSGMSGSEVGRNAQQQQLHQSEHCSLPGQGVRGAEPQLAPSRRVDQDINARAPPTSPRALSLRQQAGGQSAAAHRHIDLLADKAGA